MRSIDGLQPQATAALRIMTALVFLQHGTMKILAFPTLQPGAPVPLTPLLVAAGWLELVGGTLLLGGLLTRPVAFVLSGQMAVAYVIGHAGRSFYPALNNGDACVLFCFIFLSLAVSGGGAWSLDSLRARSSRG